jgi:hypothetical protein
MRASSSAQMRAKRRNKICTELQAVTNQGPPTALADCCTASAPPRCTIVLIQPAMSLGWAPSAIKLHKARVNAGSRASPLRVTSCSKSDVPCTAAEPLVAALVSADAASRAVSPVPVSAAGVDITTLPAGKQRGTSAEKVMLLTKPAHVFNWAKLPGKVRNLGWHAPALSFSMMVWIMPTLPRFPLELALSVRAKSHLSVFFYVFIPLFVCFCGKALARDLAFCFCQESHPPRTATQHIVRVSSCQCHYLTRRELFAGRFC